MRFRAKSPERYGTRGEARAEPKWQKRAKKIQCFHSDSCLESSWHFDDAALTNRVSIDSDLLQKVVQKVLADADAGSLIAFPCLSTLDTMHSLIHVTLREFSRHTAVIFGFGSICLVWCHSLFQCFLTSVWLPRRDSDLLAPDGEGGVAGMSPADYSQKKCEAAVAARIRLPSGNPTFVAG